MVAVATCPGGIQAIINRDSTSQVGRGETVLPKRRLYQTVGRKFLAFLIGGVCVLVSKGSKDGQLDKESSEVLIHLGSILPFLTTLPKDDYEYRGSGKSVDDKRCIVFWYRNKDAKFRAIFNDLTVSDVDEKDVR
jgi:hypothetical protein